MLNVPITPPRVPLIDLSTGYVDRTWYLFFLSLYNSAGSIQDGQIDAFNAALASYELVVQQAVNTLTLNSLPVAPLITEDNLTPVVIASSPIDDDLTPLRQSLSLCDVSDCSPSVLTWSPSVTATTPGATPPIISSATGTYFKIGSFVYVTYNILLGANGTGAGTIKCDNLPFTLRNRAFGNGVESDVVGFNTVSNGIAGTNYCIITKFDGTYPAGTSYRLLGNFSYLI